MRQLSHCPEQVTAYLKKMYNDLNTAGVDGERYKEAIEIWLNLRSNLAVFMLEYDFSDRQTNPTQDQSPNPLFLILGLRP